MIHLKQLYVLVFALTSFFSYSQEKSEFSFDTKYFEAVDKWVVFPKQETDTTYAYGFIYLDNEAGFTFNFEARLHVKQQHLLNIPKDSTVSMRYRLEPNTSLVSVLNENQIKELNLPHQPKWLAIYKKDSKSVEYLKNVGYHYNHVGASHLALNDLEKAYKIEPHHEGLEFEVAYAYNALSMFEKAIPVLKKAIANDPNNYIFYKELGYAYKNVERIKDAEKTYRKGIEISDNDFENSEMAVNMAQSYFFLRNRKKFDEWAEITRKYAEPNSQYAEYIAIFEREWNKK